MKQAKAIHSQVDPAGSSAAPAFNGSQGAADLPDSFADWLAQPADDITAEAESDNDVFPGMLKGCPPPAAVRRCA